MSESAKPPAGMRSIFEVSEHLGIHEQTVRDIIRRGELGTVRIGKRILVRDDQLAAFIDAHTIDADAV